MIKETDYSIVTSRVDPDHVESLELSTHQKRVLLFDPAPVYARIEVNHYKRVQPLQMAKMFPQIEPGICACGCGEELTGRRSRWATDDCSNFVGVVYAIIAGNHDVIKRYVTLLYGGWACCNCNGTWKDCPDDWGNGYGDWIQKDHIIAVKKGGGGCWLNNYQPLCHICHTKKTKAGGEHRPMAAISPASLPTFPIQKELF